MSKYIANSFQVPNAIVDEVMNKVTGNAFKCYMLIVRKTTGWNKVSDRIATTLFIEKTGISKKPTVYKALAELEALNLIVSEKKLGQMNTYWLNFDLLNQCPEEVVPQNGTSTHEGHGVVPQNGTSTSTPKGYSTKHTIKHTIQNTNTEGAKDAPVSPKSLLLENGVSEQLAKDYLAVRESKKARTFTQTAFNGLKREADKANLTIEQAVTVCVERNWVGFNHEWLQATSKGVQQPTKADQLAAANRSIFGKKKGAGDDFIDGDCQRI